MFSAKTSVVSADKRSAVCQDIPSSLPTQGRPRSGRPCVRNAQGMSWQTADLLSADTTDVLAADTTDVLPADTTDVLPADNPGFLWKDQTHILGCLEEKCKKCVLHLVAPFGVLRGGFCSGFHEDWLCALVGVIWKSSQNRPLGRFWVDVVDWGDFGCKKWSQKNMFCGGMILWWGCKGIPPAQMNSMVPGSHMGRLLRPQPPLKNKFYANSLKSGKLQVASVASLLSLARALLGPWALLGPCVA